MDKRRVYVLQCAAPGCRSRLAMDTSRPLDITHLDQISYEHRRIIDLILQSGWSWTRIGHGETDFLGTWSAFHDWMAQCGNHNSGRVEVTTVSGVKTLGIAIGGIDGRGNVWSSSDGEVKSG